MSRAGFHGRTEEIGNDYEEDGGKNQIQKSQFLAERGAVLLGRPFGGSEQVGSCSGQVAGAYPKLEGALVCIGGKLESIFFAQRVAVEGRVRML
jgi:hypothetical protein